MDNQKQNRPKAEWNCILGSYPNDNQLERVPTPRAPGKTVDLRGLEPLNLLYAIQALYQLSYRPINIRGISSNSCNISAEK